MAEVVEKILVVQQAVLEEEAVLLMVKELFQVMPEQETHQALHQVKEITEEMVEVLTVPHTVVEVVEVLVKLAKLVKVLHLLKVD